LFETTATLKSEHTSCFFLMCLFYIWLSKFVTGRKGVVFENAIILLYFTEDL